MEVSPPNKLVLFDIDGTLVTGRHGHAKAFTDAFDQVYEIQVTIDWIAVQGMTDKQIIYQTLRERKISEREINAGIGQLMIEMVRSFKKSIHYADITTLPGVPELLEELEKKNYLIGHVTGNLKQIAESKMQKLELDRYFSLGGYGSMHESRTALVQIALKQADTRGFVREQRNVYLFGDAPQDMQAGQNAGIITIGVTTGKFNAEQLEPKQPYKILENLADTEYVLNLLN